MSASDYLFLALVLLLSLIPLIASTLTTRGKLIYSVALAGWLALMAVLAQQGLFAEFKAMPPRLGLVLFPPFIFAVITALLAKAKALRDALPVTLLLGLQSFRIVMEIDLWMLYREGRIPVQMTFEGRNFDILVGLTAPVIAYLYHKQQLSKTWVIIWNIGGLLILANIVGTALLSIPTPFRVFMNEPANTIVAYWPFVWLPGFVVPVAYTCHFYCLRRLMKPDAK